MLSLLLATANDFTSETVLNISLSKNVFINVGFKLFFVLNISIISSCRLC